MKETKQKRYILIIGVLLSLLLGILYFFHNFPDWDQIGQIENINNYVKYGIKEGTLFETRAWVLNINYVLEYIFYHIFGPNQNAAYAYIVFFHFFCCLFALYIIENKKVSNIWIYAIYAFLMLPNFTYGVLEGTSYTFYCRQWWQFTHKEVALLAVVVFYEYYIMKQKNISSKKIILTIIATIIVGQFMINNLGEELLIIESIIIPLTIFYILRYKRNIFSFIKRRWVYVVPVSVIVLGGLYYLFAHNIITISRGGWFTKIDLSDIKSTLHQFVALMFMYFSAHDIDGGWFRSNPLYFFKILLLIVSWICVVWNIVLGVINYKKVQDIDLLISISIFINAVVGVLTNTNFIYCQVAYYLLGVVLCRKLVELFDCKAFVRLRDKNKVVIKRIAVFFSLFLCISFLTSRVVYASSTRYNIWVNSNTTLYDACTEFLRYAEENNLKYGNGEEAIIGLLELVSDGKLDIAYVVADENGNIVPRNVNDYVNNIGSNYTNYIIDDSLTNYGHYNEEMIIANYGMYQDRKEFYNRQGEYFFTCYIYDYDIRVNPSDLLQIASDDSNLDIIEKGRIASYYKDFELGTYRLDITGKDVHLLDVTMSLLGNDNISMERIFSSVNKVSYEIKCKDTTEVLFTFANMSEQNIEISDAKVFCTYAAVDVIRDTICLNNNKEFSYTFNIPKGKFNIVVKGDNIDLLEFKFANVDYDIINIGKEGCSISINNFNDINETTMIINSNSSKKSSIKSIDYEISINDRDNYTNCVYLPDTLQYSGDVKFENGIAEITPGEIQYGPYIPLTHGSYLLKIEGNNIEKGDFDIACNVGTRIIEYSLIEQGEGYMFVEFEMAENAENVEFRIRNNVDCSVYLKSYYLKQQND